MNERNWLAERFEENREHLRGVAYRILGSLSEADDAIQEAWLRLSRSDAAAIANLGGWLTTVTARVCLDMLRSRNARKEEALDRATSQTSPVREGSRDPEQEMLLADSVGIALLVVLDRLSPAERLAFVMHDLFGSPFEEIASVIGRSPEAARQLASRARRRVRGAEAGSGDIARQRSVAEAFLTALRAGDFQGLLSVLDPEVAVRVDRYSAASGKDLEIHGAVNWARGAIAFAAVMREARPMLVDGQVGIVLAPSGRLSRVLRFSLLAGKISEVEVIGDPVRLQQIDLAVLPGGEPPMDFDSRG